MKNESKPLIDIGYLLILFLGLSSLVAPWFDAKAAPRRLVIFAAASTQDALTDIVQHYEDKFDTQATLIFAGTADLVRQIRHGHPEADAVIFLSADTQWMDALAADGLILPETRRPLLTNSLVLIAPSDSAWRVNPVTLWPLPDLLHQGRLALGEPQTVPAGRYAKTSLQNLGVWEQVKNRLIPTQNVRAALNLVLKGEAIAGIVYQSDLHGLQPGQARIVTILPQASYPQPVYPVAAVPPSDPLLARQFIEYLASPEARALFEQYGFQMLENAQNVP